jgi:DNA-binding MarR family transcriptional regulator
MAKTTQPNLDTIARECIAVRMRMLNRVVTNIYNEALRPLDLKVSQMNILVSVGKLKTAQPTEVCDRLHLDLSTLSRNVQRMKTRGWLEIIPCADGRAQPVRLTAAGRRLLQKAGPAWLAAQQQAQSLLGQSIVDQLGTAVERLPTQARPRKKH